MFPICTLLVFYFLFFFNFKSSWEILDHLLSLLTFLLGLIIGYQNRFGYGYEYFITFTDDYLRFGYVYLM